MANILFTLNLQEVGFISLTVTLALLLYILLGKYGKLILSRSFDFSIQHYLLGIISTLSICYAFINLTIESQPYIYQLIDDIPDETIIIPNTWQEPKKIIPPPAARQKEEILLPQPIAEIIPVKTLEEVVEVDDFKDQAIDEPMSFNADSMMQATKKFIPKVIQRDDADEILVRAEQMPRFPGCEDIEGSMDEKQACAEQRLLSFIYNNLKYPQVDKENRYEGTVIIRFVVDKYGNVVNTNILRDIGINCGKEAKRVVELMNDLPQKWTPGKQRGNAVNVQFTLPVKFKLL